MGFFSSVDPTVLFSVARFGGPQISIAASVLHGNLVSVFDVSLCGMQEHHRTVTRGKRVYLASGPSHLCLHTTDQPVSRSIVVHAVECT